jgi:hypothetical protein
MRSYSNPNLPEIIVCAAAVVILFATAVAAFAAAVRVG